MRDQLALFDTQEKRYQQLALLLLTAPVPITAVAHLLGDHAGRLDALCDRIDHLEAALRASEDRRRRD